MSMGRLAVTGAALLALAGLSACDDKEPAAAGTPEATSAASAAAAKELAAAATKLTASSGKLDLTMTGGVTGTGAFDTKHKLLDLKLDLTGFGDVSVRAIGDDLYVKVSGSLAKSFAGGDWMHLDAAKMPAGSTLSPARIDPRIAVQVLTEATGVRKTGDRTYTGTVDSEKLPLTGGFAAADVPFTAEVAPGGYLSKLTLDSEAVVPGSGKTVTSYSEIGAKVDVKAPAKSQTVEMPAKTLQALGGE
ncbi:hypothetical protein [Actinoplanes regularis]|uniref:Lipoprotein LprG n=1 Tax=Actinoplanes regularis TaxID=52697 RepID=A0A238ZYH3_9ACTN|nr:hypothetical protein [Actinoplanes regularis]GIE90203.1 hypothetical protein Are01nite_66830 [Actinoplanes regularis]SNR87703.1 hypothetical protein SAMN06264365_106366 [Actinoplanes regularis]